MSTEFGYQRRPPFLGLLVVPYLSEPVVHLNYLMPELLPTRLSDHYEVTLAALAAVMGKAKEVKRVGLAALSFCVFTLILAKADSSRLLGM